MASLHDFLSYFLSGVDDLCKQLTDLHTTAAHSAKQFYDTGFRLTDNITGQGADAFFNVFALNNRQCQLLIDKVNDYYNAADAFRKGLTEVTSPYDDYHDTVYHLMWTLDATGEQYTNMTAREIWDRLRAAFVSNASLDDVVNQNTAQAAIAGPLNTERDQILQEINGNFQPVEDELTSRIKVTPNDANSTYQLSQLRDQQSAANNRVQMIVTNLQTNLENWSLELTRLLQTFINEIEVAAKTTKLDQITVSDLIYEANLPQNTNKNVLIEQLPDGGLIVLVKEGNAGQIENDIQQFLSDHGYAGQNPAVTIMGYRGGESVAEQIVQDAYNRLQNGSPLPFHITNTIMVGSNLPDPTGLPGNYIAYQTMPVEKQRPFYELTPEQYAIMGLTLLLAIPTEGGSLLLDGEEITGSMILQAAGKEGVSKIEEYAVAMGYNSTHPDTQSEADFLAHHLKNYPNYTNQISFSVDGGKHVLSPDQYHALYPNPSQPPENLQVYYKGVLILPEEVGLKTTLTNDAYLGSQVVPDP